MNLDNELNKLKKIQQVEPPPFLFTRIKARIDSLAESAAPKQWKWAFGTIGIIVLVLNVSVFFMDRKVASTEVEEYVQSMDMSISNELYYD